VKRRRVHALTSTGAVATNMQLIGTIDESNGVNVHGVRVSFIIEPENADANANGHYALWCMPDEISAVPVPSSALLELEGSNAFLWAVGTFAASNQTPTTINLDLGTSRNCQQGARIVLVVNREGVSAGNVRIRAVMTFFTTSL